MRSAAGQGRVERGPWWMDKTGTLTTGRPSGLDVAAAPGHDPDEVLRLAAAVDQLSPHVLAESIVHFARARGCALPLPTDVSEQPEPGSAAS
ncbi:probable cation transporting ATPase [Rhodococcus jostii RHA1]|uniref:Probable cation transporting ATPase n=1 Tax=Rhodococcus jostii (strain RHA1) TaxID=101510 RepID=Q0SKP8_RHOJR|nr:probable cation transporting ATPase [Rhodococcus jostii RHA1]